jgi:hypothetical protein
MGLLGKAIVRNLDTSAASSASAAPTDIQAIIADFHRKVPLFHCIVLQGSQNINGMIASLDAVCVKISGGNSLILLPGALDRELFAHRLSRSADLAVLFQFSANSPSLAIETLGSYLR